MANTTPFIENALREARSFARSFSPGDLPIDVFEVARSLGVQDIAARSMTSDGYLGVRSDGALIIRYRADNAFTRTRFTVGHEIGHILLARVKGEPITSRKDRSPSCSDIEERACDRIAAEILMPEHILRDELARLRPGWNAIRKLQTQFSVSNAAIILRLLHIRWISLVSICYFGRRLDHCRLPYATCKTSSGLQFVGTKPRIEKTIRRVWTEAQFGNCHSIKVFTEFGPEVITCEGKQRTNSSLKREEYGVIGWNLRLGSIQ